MTGYMSEMRKLVGHRTIIQCAASVICVDVNGKILLGKRTDNHKWAYAGGSVEIDEYAEDCAKRELYEEMGISAQSLEFFFVNSGPETHYIYPNGDEVSNFEIVYLCSEWEGEPKMQDGEMAYCMVGYGDVPVKKCIALLKQSGYDGYFSLEWVKRWNMSLEEPGIAFAKYAGFMRNL